MNIELDTPQGKILLSLEEAEKLYRQLKRLFDQRVETIPVPQPYPVPVPYIPPVVIPSPPPPLKWEIWCENGIARNPVITVQ